MLEAAPTMATWCITTLLDRSSLCLDRTDDDMFGFRGQSSALHFDACGSGGQM
jgi:hypothetical protein